MPVGALPVVAGGAEPALAPEPAVADHPRRALKSPMVGTAYVGPQPGAGPFVTVGDTVLGDKHC